MVIHHFHLGVFNGLCVFHIRICGFRVVWLTIKLGNCHANSWNETKDLQLLNTIKIPLRELMYKPTISTNELHLYLSCL